MNIVLQHPVLFGLGIYYLITMFMYWFFVLRTFAPSTVKTLNVVAYGAILLAPLLIPFALTKALFSLVRGK